VAKLAVVDNGERDESQRHAQEIEEERRGVLKSVLDEDEGCAPYEDDCQEKQMGKCCGAESLGQLLLGSCGEDGFAVDYGAEDFCVEELLRGCCGDVSVEDDDVGEIAGFEAPLYFFAELAEGRGLGVGVDGFVERDFFLGLEDLGAGFVLASDGGVKAAEGIDELDWVVGSEGEDYVVV